MRGWLGHWCVVLLLLALVGCSTAAPANSVPASQGAPSTGTFDFKGKTVHLVVGYSAGGGFDANARLLAPELQAALAGNPTVVVDNQPGADSLLAAKTVLTQSSKTDEVDVVVFVSTLLAKSVLNGGLDGFAIEKQAVFVGMPDGWPEPLALCAHKSTVGNLETFLSRSEPLKVGGLTGSSYYDALLRWVKLAGFPVDLVFGYAATAPLILAFNQGEIDALPACRDQDLQQNPDWLNQDQITPLFGLRGMPAALKQAQAQGRYPWLKDVVDAKPISDQLKATLKAINDLNTGTNVYAVSKQTPAAAQQALQQAFQQAVLSANYKTQMEKRQLEPGYRGPQDLAALLDQINGFSSDEKSQLSMLLGT
jgi:molybdopterin-guanine dinucleotide biosynthesis protein A